MRGIKLQAMSMAMAAGVLGMASFACAEDLVVADGMEVSIRATMKVDGQAYGQPNRELSYTHGAGEMRFKELEKGMAGMKKGEKKEITLAPKDAFGEAKTEDKVAMDRLPEGAQVGSVLYKGGQIPCTLTAIESGIATLSCENPSPLAGKTVVFEVEILDIKKAE